MKNLKTSDAEVRNSFIAEFAYGDKSKALNALIKRAHEENHTSIISSNEEIYSSIVCEQQAYARLMRLSLAIATA